MEEWEAAFYAYRAAQARVATGAAYLSLLEWERTVNPTAVVSSSASWLRYTVRVIRGARRRQQLLAQSYLQYVRALEIGEPPGRPVNGADGGLLEDYRQAFLDGLQDAALMGEAAQQSSWPADADWDYILAELRQVDPEGASANARAASFVHVDIDRHIQEFLDSWGPNARVTPVNFQWPPLEAGRNDAAHERHFRELVREVQKEIAAGGAEEVTREQAREALREAARTAGSKLAGQVMLASTDAADQVTTHALRSDRKIKAVARGTTATPCWFCAMLASRGFVYSGGSFGGGDMTTAFRRVHPNCQCYPIIRYVHADQLPALNQKFKDMWENAPGAGHNKTKAFRRALYDEGKDEINAKRRRYRSENSVRLNAKRRQRNAAKKAKA
jgi:hypothetical protein